MRKKINAIILSILVILGIVALIFIKPIKHKLKVLYYEKELNKYFNLKKSECIIDYSNQKLDYYLSQPINEYDITKFINYYFEQIVNKGAAKIDTFADSTNIHMHAMDLSDFVDKENVNINDVAKKLEKIFIHKSDDIYKEWYLPADSKEEVDMPLGYYYIYEKSDYKKLDDIKEVKDFIFTEDIDFEKSKFYKYKMTIELIDGNIKEYNDTVEYISKHKMFEPYLNDVYYEEHEGAHITLGNHDLHDAYDGFWDNLDSY